MPAPAKSFRILLAIGIYQPEHGGAAEWLRNYALWLRGRGHEVTIVCDQSEGAAPEGCRLLTLPKLPRARSSYARATALQKLVDQHPRDIAYDTGCLLASDVFHPLMGSIMHNWYRQLRAYPLALRLRRFWHVRLWRDVRLQLQQQRHHRLLIACSKKVAADFGQLGCRQAVVIHNGIRVPPRTSPEEIQNLRRQLGVDDRLLVLVTATNFYLKGVMTVLRALTSLDAETRGKFLVVIAGHNRVAAFQQYIDKHALHACCRITGWVKNIDAYYHAADIFLHPTYHDAGSLSTLKGLAAGCAVVTSRFDGSADLIQDGINGLVLDRPEDARALAGILRRLLDSGLRQQLGAAARLLAPEINEERQFHQLEAACSRLAATKTCAT